MFRASYNLLLYLLFHAAHPCLVASVYSQMHTLEGCQVLLIYGINEALDNSINFSSQILRS